MAVRIVVAQGESIGQALLRFHKLLDRNGVYWEQRRRRAFIKPCKSRREKRFKKKFKARKATLHAKIAHEHSRDSVDDARRIFWKRTGKQ